MRRTLAFTVLLTIGVTALEAGPQPLPPPGAAVPQRDLLTAMEEPAFANLLRLPGSTVEVRYAPDALDRASRVQARLEALHALFSRLSQRDLVWKGVVVDQYEWKRRALYGIWGVPVRLGSGTFVVPARGDEASIATTRWLLQGAPPDPGGEPLQGSREEAGSLVVSDLLLQLDIVRAFAENAPLSGEEPWITGVLLQLAARYAWEKAEPGRMLEILSLFDRFAAAHGGPRRYRLTDYRGGLPLQHDLWYQAQFVRGADAIWVEEGERGTANFLGSAARRGKPLTRKSLERKYDRLRDWELAAFAP